MAALTSGEITIGYDDEGSGDALVLVHGHPFNRSMWRPQAERFSRSGWRVIAPDLRGYGQTTVVPGEVTLDVFARDLVALLDALGVGPIVLGGLSMGGQIVLEFYRQFGDRVRALLLADTAATPDSPETVRWRRHTAERLLRQGMGPYADEVLAKMMTPANIGSQPAVAGHVLAMMRDTAPIGAAAALRGRVRRPDYTPVCARISVPTLVLVGSEDEFTPLSDARHLRDHIPGAQLEVVDGAGHLPNLEREAEFSAVVQKFLDALSAPRG